jgi:hypothetical protein
MEFIKVNNASIDIKTALQWQFIVGNTDFLDNTLSNAAIVQYAKEEGISASAEELQTFFNEFRYKIELESKNDFQTWVNDTKLDLNVIQSVCEVGVLRNKIRASISDQDVTDYYTESKDEHDVAELYSITVDSQDLANEILAQIEEEEASFMDLALEYSNDASTFRQGGFNGEVTREDVRAEVEAEVFSASAGGLIGPVKEDDSYTIYMVRAIISPAIEDIKEMLRDTMFDNLLDYISGSAAVHQSILGIEDTPPNAQDE